MDRLMFALISDCLAEVRRVPSRCGRRSAITFELLRARFTPWERGTLLNAACFLVELPDVSIEIPSRAFSIAHRILDAEASGGFLPELVAASMAGAPWRGSLSATCVRCGRLGTWRPILEDDTLPVEIAWRYERPENHLPLCRRCASRLAFRQWENRFELARAVWGLRFEALLQWHIGQTETALPADWDQGSDPLWPSSFGGPTWSEGSGAVSHAEPRSFHGARRNHDHHAALERLLGVARAEDFLAGCTVQDPAGLFNLPADQTAGTYAGALT